MTKKNSQNTSQHTGKKSFISRSMGLWIFIVFIVVGISYVVKWPISLYQETLTEDTSSIDVSTSEIHSSMGDVPPPLKETTSPSIGVSSKPSSENALHTEDFAQSEKSLHKKRGKTQSTLSNKNCERFLDFEKTLYSGQPFKNQVAHYFKYFSTPEFLKVAEYAEKGLTNMSVLMSKAEQLLLEVPKEDLESAFPTVISRALQAAHVQIEKTEHSGQKAPVGIIHWKDAENLAAYFQNKGTPKQKKWADKVEAWRILMPKLGHIYKEKCLLQ